MSLSRFTRTFGLRLPVVQGPFGGGLSTVALAAAASSGGALASYGAHLVAPQDIATLTTELRAACAGPFALNLWLSAHDPGAEGVDPDALESAWQVFAPWFDALGVERPAPPPRLHPDPDAQIEAVIEAGPPVFSFVFGVPSAAVLDACRRRGILTLGTATSIAEAEALQAAGVDAIVATGFEAGGHRVSFLARAEESLMGTFALTQLVADRIDLPVVAAGGIADARGVRAAIALGAQGAQIGTAFLACEESGAAPAHRAALFSPRALDTVLTRSFTGRLARGLRNRWTETFAQRSAPLPPFPITSWYVGQLRAAALARGDIESISLWCGQIAPNLRHRRAADLLSALAAGLDGASQDSLSPAASGRHRMEHSA